MRALNSCNWPVFRETLATDTEVIKGKLDFIEPRYFRRIGYHK